MAKASVEMVEEFKTFIDFVQELKMIEEEHWNSPISEGKWSLKDVICHIMLWDIYFYEEGIEKIKLGQSVTVRHLNFDEFNANAREYAKTQTRDSIMNQFFEYRNKIIDDITGLPEEDYIKEYKDGDGKKFSIRGYLRGFIPHDKHHKKQIEKYVKSIQ
ncbi:hypothetical protein AWM70_12245 [Paenibacillus yonginensis]|uniref:DinB-like domain-containing protein n=1 Tax=Paenibacillus yonginensis TaxID=1462996 RepID=A0A1B1N1J4_9BACL|nr:DinB family protein [Paenibacillus yonginensis]ANS75279.1 hypothetical protein AWM70_12245 [Paenibacillus yonginensis]